MAYTALASAQTGALKGLRDPIDYGTGIEWASGLMNRYPNASLQLGLKENNFLGKGQKVKFQSSLANTRSTYDISITEPFSRIIVMPFSFETSSKIGLRAFNTSFLDPAINSSIFMSNNCLSLL